MNFMYFHESRYVYEVNIFVSLLPGHLLHIPMSPHGEVLLSIPVPLQGEEPELAQILIATWDPPLADESDQLLQDASSPLPSDPSPLVITGLNDMSDPPSSNSTEQRRYLAKRLFVFGNP